MSEDWVDVGAADELGDGRVHEVRIARKSLAVGRVGEAWGAISGTCNHAGGPLGQGALEGEYVTCPWHSWKFHFRTGEGEPGFEEDRVPRHDVRVEAGRVLVSREARSKRNARPHAPHPLARPVERAAGPVRVAGISATVMDRAHPRTSTSELLLETSLAHAKEALGCETQLIRLDSLAFRSCEGYYSKSAHACTWPCSITQMDVSDEMTVVYEALVHWADVVLLATPIRWGNASSAYYRMAERLNCVQNQITIRDRVLIRNKVCGFVITGGQDNIQAVAGQLLGFFGELGFHSPQFPYIAHSRGWTAEDMERNVAQVVGDEELHEGARQLAGRCAQLASRLLAADTAPERTPRGGRKAHSLAPPEGGQSR